MKKTILALLLFVLSSHSFADPFDSRVTIKLYPKFSQDSEIRPIATVSDRMKEIQDRISALEAGLPNKWDASVTAFKRIRYYLVLRINLSPYLRHEHEIWENAKAGKHVKTSEKWVSLLGEVAPHIASADVENYIQTKDAYYADASMVVNLKIQLEAENKIYMKLFQELEKNHKSRTFSYEVDASRATEADLEIFPRRMGGWEVASISWSGPLPKRITGFFSAFGFGTNSINRTLYGSSAWNAYQNLNPNSKKPLMAKGSVLEEIQYRAKKVKNYIVRETVGEKRKDTKLHR